MSRGAAAMRRPVSAPEAIFPIRKGVPIPPKRYGGPRRQQPCPYPFMDMEVGDTFLAPAASPAAKKVEATKLNRWARIFRQRERIDFRISVRTDTTGVWCWRIK